MGKPEKVGIDWQELLPPLLLAGFVLIYMLLVIYSPMYESNRPPQPCVQPPIIMQLNYEAEDAFSKRYRVLYLGTNAGTINIPDRIAHGQYAIIIPKPE